MLIKSILLDTYSADDDESVLPIGRSGCQLPAAQEYLHMAWTRVDLIYVSSS